MGAHSQFLFIRKELLFLYVCAFLFSLHRDSLTLPCSFPPTTGRFVCSLMHTSVFGLRRSSIPGGLQSSVGPPAELLYAAPPPFVLPANLSGRDFVLPCWTALERLTGIGQYLYPCNPTETGLFGCWFTHTSVCQVLWFQWFIPSSFLSPRLVAIAIVEKTRSGVRKAG